MTESKPTRPDEPNYDLDSMELDESEANYDAEETNAKEEK